nr:nucleotidyl transferase AbiEii/AbiGii toxin family protein [Streptococcus suis]
MFFYSSVQVNPRILNWGSLHIVYKAIFDEDNFPIIAYTIETILAEKLQTIYSRNFLNSRSKDFYDVYILSKLKKEDIDFIQLRNACQRTFSYRETELDFVKIIELLERFKSDPIQNKQWQNYSKKYSYTKGISLADVLDEMISLITIIISTDSIKLFLMKTIFQSLLIQLKQF